MRKQWRLYLGAWVLMGIVSAVARAGQPPTIASFFRAPALSRVVISPDGLRLATVVATKAGRLELAIMDLEHREQSRMVAGFIDADVRDVYWVNDNRLVYTTIDLSDKHYIWGGLFAVNRDGSGFKRLVSADEAAMTTGTSIVSRILPPDWEFYGTIEGNTDDVIVRKSTSNATQTRFDVALGRLNTVTGSMSIITGGAPEATQGWVLDHLGNPRAAITWLENRGRVYWKASKDAPWQLLEERDGYSDGGFLPQHVAADGTLYVTARAEGRDTLALHRFDFATKSVDPTPLISLKGYDFEGDFETSGSDGRILGLHYESDGKGTLWFDPGLRKIQAIVDASLPATINELSCGRCEDAGYVLVKSWSDRQPAVYYVYDRHKQRLESAGQSRPWIQASAMGTAEFTRYTARDGLTIPVLVTYPPSGKKGPFPAVVMVHGGPYVRGTHWAWEREAQFLASRGYVVIEPEFRGSTGYGKQLFRSGWKQWGLAMQDDVADAAKWAAARQIADPQRTCIAGASYGGYAVLMGLAKNPELFKCGIDWVGVSDIELMYSITWSDAGNSWLKYGMPVMIGDPVKDKAQLDATSPIKLASRITQPLLLAYGALDRRVPLDHGRQFLAAVKPYNKDVEYVEYPWEGHGWHRMETNLDFWSRVEKFLARQIGADAAQ